MTTLRASEEEEEEEEEEDYRSVTRASYPPPPPPPPPPSPSDAGTIRGHCLRATLSDQAVAGKGRPTTR
ncbi:hypothetical protein E2C01_071074 [Portunus trituberculatus]|uniref:Uncharacterized protein n=1 Tax=Portunus trituberculatus TaxID=210409 RepID=A0A5B7HUF6_PORTR|nr:hypothetical protein [Portunus trituberculatus]